MGDGLGRVPPDVGGRSSEDGERESEDGALDDNDTRPRHKTSRHVYDASNALTRSPNFANLRCFPAGIFQRSQLTSNAMSIIPVPHVSSP